MSTATPTPAAERLARLADPATRPAPVALADVPTPAPASAPSSDPPQEQEHPPLDPAASRRLEPVTDDRSVRVALGRRGGIALLAAVLVLAGIALAQLLRSEPVAVSAPQLPTLDDDRHPAAAPGPQSASPPDPETAADPATASGAQAPAPGGPPVVSVVGLVERPGLVTLAPQARAADALEAAGGTLPGADTGALNLARPVADGEQIIVGALPGPDNPEPMRSQVIAPGQPVLGAPAAAVPPAAAGASQNGAGPAAGGAEAGDVVNLNTADEAALEKLPGVGPATAAAIIAHREANGPFTSVEQLLEVDGIGPGKLDKLKDKATV